MNTNDHMLVSFATQTLNVEDQFYKGIASIERLAFLLHIDRGDKTIGPTHNQEFLSRFLFVNYNCS